MPIAWGQSSKENPFRIKLLPLPFLNIRWLTAHPLAWSASLPRSQWWPTMRWTPPATCILSINLVASLLSALHLCYVITALLPLFFGMQFVTHVRLPTVARLRPSTHMHPCCHSFVATLFGNVISCVFENAVRQGGKCRCVTHPCVSRAPPAYPFKEGGSWMSVACALVFGYTASSGATCLSYQRRWQMLHAILICFVTLCQSDFGTRAPPVYPFKEGGSRCMRFGLLLCNTWCTIWLTVLLWRGAYKTNIYTFVQWLERGAFNLLQTFDVFPWFCPFPHHFWCQLTLGVY